MVVGEALEAPSPPLQGGAIPSQLTHRFGGKGENRTPISGFFRPALRPHQLPSQAHNYIAAFAANKSCVELVVAVHFYFALVLGFVRRPEPCLVPSNAALFAFAVDRSSETIFFSARIVSASFAFARPTIGRFSPVSAMT